MLTIANRLTVHAVESSASKNAQCDSFFVSHASKNRVFADAFRGAAEAARREVVFGDLEVRSDRSVPVAIADAMRRCEIFVVLWSREYALSPHCYAELDFALTRRSIGQCDVWLFNLDGSDVVPTGLRDVPGWKTGTPARVAERVRELLARSSLDRG